MILLQSIRTVFNTDGMNVYASYL